MLDKNLRVTYKEGFPQYCAGDKNQEEKDGRGM
jgi:hypothetical protein